MTVKVGVNEAWLRGLKDEERENMRQFVIGNQKLLDKLKEILYNMSRRTEEFTLTDYDNTSWSHKQAHLNGEAAILRKLLEICTLKDRDDRPQ